MEKIQGKYPIQPRLWSPSPTFSVGAIECFRKHDSVAEKGMELNEVMQFEEKSIDYGWRAAGRCINIINISHQPAWDGITRGDGGEAAEEGLE